MRDLFNFGLNLLLLFKTRDGSRCTHILSSLILICIWTILYPYKKSFVPGFCIMKYSFELCSGQIQVNKIDTK